MAKRSRIAASLAAGALLGSVIQTPAFASAPSSGHGGGSGIINAVKGWFGGGHSAPKPPTGPKGAIADRQKLPPGKKAPAAHRVRELTSRRTPSARYWKLSDGTTQAEVSAVPLSYHSADGWKAIDTKVAASGRVGYRYANTTNLARSYFGSRSGSLLRFEADGKHTVTLGLTGTDKAVSPVVKGDTVTYRGLAAGADVDYRVGRGEVKENIVLNRAPSSPVSFAFTLKTGGLTPKQLKDGSIGLYGGSESGRPVMVIPAAVMFQAPANSDAPVADLTHGGVVQKLSRHGSSWRITLTPDARWLAAKDRRFPVTVDPTVMIAPTPSTSQDVMVDSTQPTTNLNGTWQLGVGTTATGTLRSLLKFPLTGIPSNTPITSAQLGVYYNQVHTANTNSVVIEAHRATGAWDASTATWNSASGLSGELSGTTVQLDDGDTGTAAHGSWPYSNNSAYTQYAVNGDYAYNKDAVAGDTYTWQPTVAQAGSYRVDVHSIPASDRATNAPYTVTYNGGTYNGTIDQSAGSGGVWRSLNNGTALPFSAGTAGKIVLGDGPVSTTTSVIADAVRLVEPGTTLTKAAGSYDQWHNFAVTDTVQKWVNGTTNNGFVLQAADESTLGQGGPLYEASEFGYGGETTTYPKLTIIYGTPGVTVNPPTVIHATGAELSWPAYTDPTPGTDPSDDLAEYQVHRSVFQGFTPSAATLVAPVAAGTTSFTDTTAVPTAADAPDPFHAVYYEVAVKTQGGQVIGGPVQLAELPKAGQTTQIIQAGQSDTTLSSAQPTTAHDTISSDGVNQKWLEVGNNSATYGKTRAALKFPTSSLPSTARVISAQFQAWSTITTNSGGGQATYELRALNRDFDEATATWNNATSSTAWTTAGGDYSSTVSDTVAGVTNDPVRHWWDATSLTQGWITTPTSNHGVLLKVANESTTSGPQERSVFASSETSEAQLRPQLDVTYVDATTDSTYYAPSTPARMTPGTTYNVDVSLTNTTNATWTATGEALSYRWTLPDGTDVTNGGNQIQTALPQDVSPGETVLVHAQVKAPTNADSGNPTNKRTAYTLTWDAYNKTNSTWNSATGGVPGLTQAETVEDPTSDTIGLEKFYSYAGKNTGAGSTVMDNLASGNAVWSYNAFTNPGRGLGTFGRFAYNSLDTSDTVMGPGWSAQASAPVRLGAALDFHPNPNPTEVTLTDGDGTASVFTKQADGTFKAPAGVHYLLAMKGGVDCSPSADDTPDAWSMTKPDGTRFFYDCEGYPSSIVDKNGNTETFTYAVRKSNNAPRKFLQYITDATGRQTLTVTYYNKGDNYSYVDDTGTVQSGTNLTNPKIIDHVASMTALGDGTNPARKITFLYTTQGLMAQLTDGAGSSQPKVFGFTYDATQGTKNVKLVKITDPRGHATQLAYYAPQSGDDPRYHWWAKTITDRLTNTTGFAYAADTGTPAFTDTTVTDAESHVTTSVTDDFARPVQTTNAKNQVTKMSWDADNNVTQLIEDNGATTKWTYDPKTGCPLTMQDAEAVKNGWPATVYTYQTRVNGYSADLYTKTSPEGRQWLFGYDTFGNLKTVTDPKGVSTPTAGDYTTTYAYDSYGELTSVTDANQHTSTYSSFDPNGYPQTSTGPAPYNKAVTTAYDPLGQVLSVTDQMGHTTTQTYDVYGRPLVKKVPKDQAGGVYITAPAPVYDANDNVTQSTAPNGAVSTAVYDNADEVTSATAPKDHTTDPTRTTSYTYDKIGELKTTTEPKGTLTTSDPTDYVTTNTYDSIGELTDVVNANGDKVSYQYDDVGNATTVIDPVKNATTDTTDYTSKTDFDFDHRPYQVTDAAGKVTKTGYDKDGLKTTTTDADNNTTTTTYDERGKVSQVQAPYQGSAGTPTYRTTKYEYDQVGNTTKVYSPRATAAGSTTAFISQTVYDELNRPKETIQPYDPADAKYNHPVSTYTYYDDAGQVTKTSAPPSNGQSVRNDTTYTYYDDGQVHTSTDPWDITTSYNYNDLGQQTSRTLTSAGGSSSRTMGWSYYPDGSLASRSDDGVPVGLQVVLVDNSDTQNTTTTGTWATASTGTAHQGYDYRTHAAGSGTDAFTWQLNIPQDGTYTVYAKYPQVTGAATAAAYTVTHDGTNTAKTVNQTTGAGTWVSLGAYSFTQGGTSSLSLAQNTGGTVSADVVKLVRDNSADTDNEKHTFTYSHDPNGNLTTIGDTSPGTAVDTYNIDYTGLNQVQKVTETASGTEKTHTSYTYDPDGQPATVDHPGQYSAYTYDLRELVQTVKVGDSATDPSPKTTTYTYTPRGQQLRQTKANNNTVDFTYWPSGSVHTQTEKTASNTLVDDHTLTWDPDGNKAEDIASKQNADNHTAYLNSTTDYTYDPVDRLAKSVKTGNGADTETYVHDDNANVISQTLNNTTTTYTYDRNRLLSSASGTTSAAYNYDPYGRLDTITSAGTVIERNTYDGFDHITKNTKLGTGGVTTTTTYAFDPLDRTASKTVGGKTTDFSYLGLTSQILDETVAGQLTKSYQYSPWGQRLSQVTHNTDGSTTDSYYGYNSHSDVETLTDSTGQTKATYGYTAYGNNDTTEFTGIDKPDAQDPTKEPYNAYRFNAKRWDQTSGTYDMGFRNYDPGLNTFTSRDMYNGALADMNLSTDPLTGNRYAFAGGNPTSMVEIDGHLSIGSAIDDIGSALKDGAQALEGALSGTADAAASEGSSLLSDVTPWGIAASVFAYASKPTPTASNGYESDPGEKPDYSKGLLLKPDSVKEWQPGDARVPFTREDCAKSRSSMIYYMPLDSQGRAQGAIACLNKADINYTDKDGNLKDPNNSTKMVGSTTMWPMSTPGAWAASPKGWRPGIGLDRSHLVARRFGGSGTDRRNLVPLPSDVNQDSMGDWEEAISDQLEQKNTVYYEISASYQGDSTIPSLQGLAASSGGAVYPWGYTAGQ
ncbi:DNRLRE domain-containing protein [Streptomyces sp. NPDC007095]|uniref:golvesin C-terminal-like domain-containing protein n=1 Tax=Streptomyces sp. NPDC007095 TaxID=3154482 RepID=UPI0033D92366